MAVVATLLTLAFLVSQTIGPLFPNRATWSWGAADLFASKGSSVRVEAGLAVTATDANRIAAVTVRHTPFPADDFLAVKVRAEGVPRDLRMSFAWSNDRTPRQMHEIVIPVEEGEPLGVLLAGHPQWQGRVTGFAVTLQGALQSAVVFEEIVFTPGGIADTARELRKGWMRFERWSLRSLSYLNGGSPTQLLTLPFVLGAAAVLAAIALLLLGRRFGAPAGWRFAGAGLATLVLVPWLLLDLRWATNLARQNRATWEQYAGKDADARQRAAEDSVVYDFARRVEGKLAPGARVFVTAMDPYLRARLAFHLRPRNVWFELRADRPPEAQWLVPGDHVVVFARLGFDFDPKEGRLRWSGADGARQVASAEALHTEPLGAVFLIR